LYAFLIIGVALEAVADLTSFAPSLGEALVIIDLAAFAIAGRLTAFIAFAIGVCCLIFATVAFAFGED